MKDKKDKSVKKKFMALALAGTMIFSLVGCGTSRVKEETDDSKIISSVDENENDLRIILLYDSLTNTEIQSELYGYLNEETLIFYDVISKKEYNFNDEEFKKFSIYSLTFEEFLSLRNKQSILKKNEDAVLDYAINKGISEENLVDIEKSYYTYEDREGNISLHNPIFSFKAHYIDEEKQNTKKEETSLTKNMN